MQRQTYAYDWLGNTTASDDDAHGFYDRSLGAIENGGNSAGPYQLTGASNVSGGTATARRGNLSTKYDEAGNLVDLAVNRATPGGECLPAGTPCNQRFLYEWDEVGRLSRARRWDTTNTGAVGDAEPGGVTAAELRYGYDRGVQRVLKTAVDDDGDERHTVYVYGSLELRRAAWNSTEGDYDLTSLTEVGYLLAGGVRLGRLHFDEKEVPTLGTTQGGSLHVLLELADHLGSGNTVLDKATGELAEKMTYQGYGSTESDYRPGRWAAMREDYRFTGKEEDSEVGLVYFGFRYLNTALGRWTSADPLTIHGLGADLNTYAYVHGNVLHATDPVGLDHDYSQNKSTQDGPGVSFGPKSPNSSNYIDFGVIVITEAPPLRVTPAPATGSGGHPGYQREGTSGNTRSGAEPNSKSDPDAYENTLELASNMPGLGVVGTTADAGVFVSSVARGKPKWESAVGIVGSIFLGTIGKQFAKGVYNTAGKMVLSAFRKFKTAKEVRKAIGNHLAYGKGASAYIKKFRQNNNDTSATNYAIAVYRRDGKLYQTQIHASNGPNMHSEAGLIAELNKNKVTTEELVEFYTERSPCDYAINCSEQVRDFLGDLSKVTWSVPYNKEFNAMTSRDEFKAFITEQIRKL